MRPVVAPAPVKFNVAIKSAWIAAIVVAADEFTFTVV